MILLLLSFNLPTSFVDFTGGAVVKNPPANTGDSRNMGWISGSGRSPGGNGNPLQYSCLGNSMGRGAWWTTVHGVTKSQIKLSKKAHIHQLCMWMIS